MEELRALARGGTIGGFVDDPPFPLGVENVSGVSLRVDAYWLRWFWAPLRRPYGLHRRGSYEERAFHGVRYDFGARPPQWKAHCRDRGYPGDAHPVTVVVMLRRPPTPGMLAEAPRSVGPHPVVYELRPPAAGYSLDAGGFVGGDDEGTLGGFLQHSGTLAYYAVSCAHVLCRSPAASAPARVYSPKPGAFGARTEVGTVRFSAYPSATGGKCNRFVTGAPSVDVAVAEVDGQVVVNTGIPRIGAPSSIAAIQDIGQEDPVRFYGHKSRRRAARVAEATLWKELSIDGVAVCFSDLFAIEHPSYNHLTRSLARGGDSGAWVVDTSGGTAVWYGMLIGGDGVRAYCCYAENVMSQLSSHSLVLP